MGINHQIDTEVIFKLGQLYDVTIHLFTTDEETNEEIIEHAMDMILCDIGINLREICKELKINPLDKKLVSIKRENFTEEEYKTINCTSCGKELTKHKKSLNDFCSACAEELLKGK